MNKQIGGDAFGNQEGPREPYGSRELRKRDLAQIRENSSTEVIDPNAANVREKLGAFIRLMYQADPEFGMREEAEVAATMLSRMHKGPLRLSMLRYNGTPLDVSGGGHVLPGQVVAINSCKQTLTYPNEYFTGLLKAKDRFSMDELTTAVMSPQSDYPFKKFSEIESRHEGHLKPGQGAGFLFLGYVDEKLRGGGLSQKMLSNVLSGMHDDLKLQYCFVYGRLPKLKDHGPAAKEKAREGRVSPPTLNKYVKKAVEGDIKDWGLLLHQRAGADVVCGLADSVDDKNSLNCGYLAIYDLKKLRANRKI